MLFWLPGVTAWAFCGQVKYANMLSQRVACCTDNITHADHEQDCEGMMAQYFFFLGLVNQYIFYCIACMFTKLANVKIKPDSGIFHKPTYFNIFGNFQFQLHNWYCVKYNYHFKIAITINSIMTMANPMIYFYTLVKPEGNTILVWVYYLNSDLIA